MSTGLRLDENCEWQSVVYIRSVIAADCGQYFLDDVTKTKILVVGEENLHPTVYKQLAAFGYDVAALAPSEAEAIEMAVEAGDRFFEVSIDMLCFLNFNGYFKRLNPAWERTCG